MIALDATMEALRGRGIECVETGWDADAIQSGNFDLCHMFHCNFDWSFGNYQAIRKAGKKYVLTPIYYPGPLLCGITRNQMHEIVNNAAMVLPFSAKERSLYDWTHTFDSGVQATEQWKKWHPIPNGTDREFHYYPAGSDGVLVVSARGDSDKGIPILRRICESIDIPLTVATSLTRDELRQVLWRRKVFVNASSSERMSLTIGEALCAGCRVLATQENWGNEWYPSLITFDPKDELKLEHLIRWALDSPDWDYRPNAAARCLTWDWVAGKLEEVYREVLSV